jgi:hypothetical protein
MTGGLGSRPHSPDCLRCTADRARLGSLGAVTIARHISPYDEQISLGLLTPVLTGGTVTGVIVTGFIRNIGGAELIVDGSMAATRSCLT